MSSAIVAPHIRLDDKGRAWIDGTTMKVVELVTDKVAYGWGPEELHRQLPHISMAQIHAALTYYYDHKSEIDTEIEQTSREAAKLRAKSTATASLRRKLRPLSTGKRG